MFLVFVCLFLLVTAFSVVPCIRPMCYLTGEIKIYVYFLWYSRVDRLVTTDALCHVFEIENVICTFSKCCIINIDMIFC